MSQIRGFWTPATRQATALLLGLAITLLGFVTLSRLLAATPLDQIAESLRAIPFGLLAASFGFTLISFGAMATYDVIAVEHTVPGRVPRPLTGLVGAASYAISNALGFSFLTGTLVRYRIYRRFGLSPADIARIVGLSWFALWFVLVLMLGFALLADPEAIPLADRLPPELDRLAGLALVVCIGGLAIWLAIAPRTLRLGKWSQQVPGGWSVAAQIVAGAVDVLAAAAALYVLLPGESAGGFVTFAIIFAVATIAGVVSNAPAGIGVFEATLIASLGLGNNPAALAAIIAYRIIYTVLPLLLTMLSLGLAELAFRQAALRAHVSHSARIIEPLVPPLVACLSFMGGLVLLISGATPGLETRLGVLGDILPLPFIEFSHLAASVSGVVLLIIARGLARRLWRAYVLALAFMVAGAVFSLAKGLDWEEALTLACLAGFLAVFRKAFYRRSEAVPLALTWRWLATVTAALIGCGWLGFFVYSHVEYANTMWWSFALDGDAPRFLRGSVVVGLLLAVAGLEVWLHRGGGADPAVAVPEVVRALVAGSANTNAQLALLGDKQFLIADDGRCFVMYARSGGSLIALGEPVGDAGKVDELAWAFRDLADRQALRPVFYEVGAHRLPLFLDMGLTALKLGEVARVDLADFSLSGARRQDMRTAMRKCEREGLSFGIIPAAEVPRHMPQLRAVSDAWLAMKSGGEKSFSLGYFDPAYLSNFDHAVMWKDGVIVAFANLWKAGDKTEISIDLMRHLPDMARGIMDALFAHVLMTAKEDGFRWFNLGAAPLAGLVDRRGASRWNRLGALIYRRGGEFYRFDGLRSFKQKFDPVWTPHYLICPRGLDTARALIDVTALISRRPGEGLRT